MSEAFSPRARLQAMLDVEAGLADALAAVGLIPVTAARAIRAAAVADGFDADRIEAEARRAGNPAIPLVAELTRRVAAADADAARLVHHGATSQDVVDTAIVLQLRASVPDVLADLDRAATAAAGLARRHAGTVMAGRTWLQQASPTTFGLKAAGWLESLARVRRELAAALEGALVLQFGGASGTLAALGDRGPAVAEALGRQLDLAVPDLPWHTQRDRLARLACALGVACGALGKIGRDLMLLAQTEVGEAFEAAAEAGGSSSMPHKRNPVRAAVAASGAVRAPGLVATLLGAMPQEHERGAGGWLAEWDALASLVDAAAASARAAAEALEHLEVDAARMRENLGRTRGLAMAEAVTVRLAARMGRADAHAAVAAACRRAEAGGRSLEEALAEDPAVAAVLDREAIRHALAPEHFLGAAKTFVTRALARHDRGDLP